MTTNFFTNETDNTLFDKFKGVFENNKNIKFFDTLVGYLRASGYFKISKLLADYTEIKLRILVGINIDILLAQANRAGNEFFKNTEKTEEEFLKNIEKDIKEAKYDKETDEGIRQFVKDIVEKKVQLKVHPEKKIHAKVYILRPKPFNEHTYGYTITGSSNFTDAGLGTVKNHNYEFNVLLNNYNDVRFATDEFERLWAEAIEIDPQHIQEIKENSHLNENVTPFELYIKLLSEYFYDMIDYNPQSLGDMPVHFKKLSYQIDAVNQGFSMLTKHNGFFLADVVGLGKTVVAALITRKFLFENGRDFTKVLVVSPPAIAKNWKQTFHDFDIDKYTKFITNGSLQKIIEQEDDYWSKEEYDLVIVDEAHRFRNHQTDSFNKLQIICKSPRKNHGLITGKQKKVILVSATPLNNKPDDIFYQLQMFQDARQSTIPGVTNLTSFFSPLMEKFKKLKRFDDVDVNELIKIYDIIRNKVIKEITIRRTRKDLLDNDDYLNDLKEQNITFPTVNPPKKIEYKMNKELNELFVLTAILLAGFSKDDDIKKEELILTAKFGINNENILKYSRYQAIAWLNEEKQKEYSNAETTAKSLAFIMKTQLIKRLESSFDAFKKSLENFKNATDRMIEMFDKDKVFIATDTNINELMSKGYSYEDIENIVEELNEKNPKNNTFSKNDFKDGFLEDLKNDAKLLEILVSKWKEIDYDPKFEVFEEKINSEFFDKKKNLEQKLVIFSESKDTIDYLERRLLDINRNDVLKISSKNRLDRYRDIVTNFDANIPLEKQTSNYNIMLTTEVLAEGVNLHRSNFVIHYDTPWNSTKLMQRIGRVNRIGTKAKEIFNYVFYPSAQGDSQIHLNKTAFIKIQAFHSALGEDYQIFSTDEVLNEEKLNKLDFKEEQDERLKYLFFLRNFKKENPKAFERIQKLPVKSSTGRNAENISNNELKNCSAAFLKTNKKFQFYKIASNLTTEISVVEAFKIFEAKQDEKRTNLNENHYDLVQLAIQKFEKDEQSNISSQIDPAAQGGQAMKAKTFLSDLKRANLTDSNQKALIQKIIDMINIGKFANLQNDIVKIHNKFKNIFEIMPAIENLAEKYDINSFTEKNETNNLEFEKPLLILSESFR